FVLEARFFSITLFYMMNGVLSFWHHSSENYQLSTLNFGCGFAALGPFVVFYRIDATQPGDEQSGGRATISPARRSTIACRGRARRGVHSRRPDKPTLFPF